MHKFITLILITFIYSVTLKAEVIKDVQVSGNKRVSVETIKIYGEIEVNKDYLEKDLNNVLSNLYLTNFFEDVKMQLLNGILKIQVKEYSIINELVVIGEENVKYTTAIKKAISSKEKDSFIKTNLTKDVDRIKTLYASLGYNFVIVNTKTRTIDERNLDLVFEIDKGNITRISKISFTGDKKVREKRLRDVIASEENKFWKFISKNTKFNKSLISLDTRLLENYYKSIGYYDVKVTSNSAEITKTGNVELIYTINAGNRYFIKKIITNVDPVFDKDLFFSLNKEYQKVVGSYYSPFKIKNLLETIDNLILKENLQFVEHNVEEIIEGDSIVVKFNIYEGEKISVERINITGNNITNEAVIRSELLLDEGDPFTKLNLDKSISRIKSRNIFLTVEHSVREGSASNLKVIDINVEEKATGEISAGAGLGTNGGSVGFNIKENNWLGEGKRIDFDVSIDAESLKGTFNYSDPNYDFLGNALNYHISSTVNDKPDQGYENTLFDSGISTDFEQYKDLYAILGVSYSHDKLTTLASASDSLKNQSGTFSDLSGQYGFTYDKRNRSFQPTSGSIASFRQSLPIYADRASISNTLSASSYKTINENIIGASKFYLTSISGLGDDNVRVSKRKGLSSSRLRGFEKNKIGPVDGKDHIGGNYAAAINFEASLPNILPESSNTDLGMFLDFGNVWGVDYDSLIDDSNKIRASTGVAASWLSPLGPMTFILSTNISKAATDETESFNFNLGTTF